MKIPAKNQQKGQHLYIISWQLMVLAAHYRKKEMPFHLSHRRDQNWSSDLQPSSKVTMSWSFSTDLERSRSLDIKERPWGIIRMAKLRCPSKESSSLLENATASCAFFFTSLMRFNFFKRQGGLH